MGTFFVSHCFTLNCPSFVLLQKSTKTENISCLVQGLFPQPAVGNSKNMAVYSLSPPVAS